MGQQYWSLTAGTWVVWDLVTRRERIVHGYDPQRPERDEGPPRIPRPRKPAEAAAARAAEPAGT